MLHIYVPSGRCNCDPARPHVTGSNDAILSGVGRTTAVSSVGAQLRPGFALEHSFGTPRDPAGQRQSRGLDWYDQVGLAAKSP
jgi:hypothetical protein